MYSILVYCLLMLLIFVAIGIVEFILFTALFSWAAGLRVTSWDILKDMWGSRKGKT